MSHTGYHYTRQQLDQFCDPEQAHARRGAHWTFDGAAFVDKMTDLRNKGSTAVSRLVFFLRKH